MHVKNAVAPRWRCVCMRFVVGLNILSSITGSNNAIFTRKVITVGHK